MSLLRAFIALDLPAKVQQDIHDSTSKLRSEIGSLVRWVPAQNLHLTLKFLGDVPLAHVDFLTQMLRVEADSHRSFDINLFGLGSFPNSKRPRVIHIGIQAPAELRALQHAVESGANRLGYQPEGRAFSPHLTIGRVKHASQMAASDQQKIRHALAQVKIDSLGTARVDSVHLYKSDLKPTGSEYTKLFSATLKK